MDALCRLDYQAASQYCTWKLLETTWKCFVSFWMASAIESLSLLSSLSRCNQNWTHTIMHHAFKTWCIVSTNGRYAKNVTWLDRISSQVFFCSMSNVGWRILKGLQSLFIFWKTLFSSTPTGVFRSRFPDTADDLDLGYKEQPCRKFRQIILIQPKATSDADTNHIKTTHSPEKSVYHMAHTFHIIFYENNGVHYVSEGIIT